MSLEQLLRIEGLSKAKAKTLLAAFELARRSLHKGLGARPVISAPGSATPQGVPQPPRTGEQILNR